VCLLCDQSLRTRVFQLERQFIESVTWVRRTEDPASPVCAPCYSGCIDAIGCVKSEYISFLPAP
jgi:hypothetical protein